MTSAWVDDAVTEYRTRLAPDDRTAFDNRLEEEIEDRSLDEIRDELIQKYEREERHLQLIVATASAFHQTPLAEGYESGYRFAFTEPLAERNELGETEVENGDVLLAKIDNESVYLCIIECKSGAHNGSGWVNELKGIQSVLQNDRYRALLARQLDAEDKEIRHIQYVLLGKLTQVTALDFNHLTKEYSIPSNFAFWGYDLGDQAMVHVEGEVEDKGLARVIKSSIDTLKVEAPIQFTFGDHPLIQLKALIEAIIDEKKDEDDPHPYEFNRRAFRERFESELQVGFEGDIRRRLVNRKVDSLLDIGLKIGIFVDSANRLSSSRDYRILFRGAKAEVAAEAADSKYFDWMPEQRRKERAFEEVRTEFSPEQTRLGDERWE